MPTDIYIWGIFF